MPHVRVDHRINVGRLAQRNVAGKRLEICISQFQANCAGEKSLLAQPAPHALSQIGESALKFLPITGICLERGLMAEGLGTICFDPFMEILTQRLQIKPFSKARSEEHTSELQSRRDLVC